jgi:asparagine synthase (glutamine-hydrolysing)
MCGIAGILDLAGRPVAGGELQAMSDVIRHRGPDDAGRWIDGSVGLANRRLAIIDLSTAGHQPMANEDGSVVVVYNGEIYNFLELVPLLEARGHRFHSRTDTEVVVHAYEEWGLACVERLNGMFAFAVWDGRRRELVLVRDRFGIKPLYYALHGDRLLFGSEIKSILAAGHPRRVSPAALNEYFTFQNLLSDRTLFDGIRLLPAGHTLTAGDNGVRVRRYWDLDLESGDPAEEEDWAEQVRAAFERVVTRQLISDVTVGSYLSGGMDSGSIAAVASRNVPRLMTFTGGFDLSSVTGIELVFDERADAEALSRELKTEHYEMVMHAGDMAWVLPELIWHLEDLRVGMCYQNYYIARLASKFVKVVLAGTGGDELFAGYPWRYELVEDVHDRDEFDRLYYGYWARLVPDAEKGAFFADDVWAEVRAEEPFELYRDTMAPVASLDPVAKALYFEAKTFLHGLLLVEDRVSMAHSLEVRVPFLDDELVRLAARIPSRAKHADREGKRVLREAMKPLLPRELVTKPKQGFSPPDQSWYRGPTMDYIREILLDERTLARGWFDAGSIRRVLAEHLEGRVNHRLLIWSLLSFEWWNRLFLDEPVASEPRSAARWTAAR